MSAETQQAEWEPELMALLGELSDVQTELLAVLAAKRGSMASNDVRQMVKLQPRDEALCDRLRACHLRHEQLLVAANVRGLPAKYLGSSTSMRRAAESEKVSAQMTIASAKMRLLQHQSLASWAQALSTILQLSQLLEMIATGGLRTACAALEPVAETPPPAT